MITEKATEQRAKELGIRVDEQMVSASIEQIARNNKMTVEELRERLRADDVSFSAFRSQVRDEITHNVCANVRSTAKSRFRKVKLMRTSPNKRVYDQRHAGIPRAPHPVADSSGSLRLRSPRC